MGLLDAINPGSEIKAPRSKWDRLRWLRPEGLLQAALPAGLAALPGGPLAAVASALAAGGDAAMEQMYGVTRDPNVLYGAVGARGKKAPLPALERVPSPLTAERVLESAAKPASISYAEFVKRNPSAGADMFGDLKNSWPALTGRPGVPRYAPAKGTSARVADAVNNPRVRARLTDMVKAGQEAMPESWYRTGPLYSVFEDELGAGAAPKAFEDLMQTVAATSPRSAVPDNIRTASYYHYLQRNGLPVPEKPAPGYGSVAQNLHRQNVLDLQFNGMDPLKRPKASSFVENLLGNETPVTVDTHNFRALGVASRDPRFLALNVQLQKRLPGGGVEYVNYSPRQAYERGELSLKDTLKTPSYWEAAPNANEYAAYEAAQQKMAQKLGITPAEWQEKMWVGGGKQTGLASPPEPFLRTLGRRIAYTAERLGANPQEVLRGFVRGEFPLLTGAGVTAGAGLLAPRDDEQD